MMLDHHFFQKLEKYKEILSIALQNNGNGSFSYDSLKELSVVYAEITNDPPCRTCSRDWLWRLGLWFEETAKSQNPKTPVEPAPTAPTKKVSKKKK